MSDICNTKMYATLPIKGYTVYINAWVKVQHYPLMFDLHIFSTMCRFIWNWFGMCIMHKNLKEIILKKLF